jgi:hypothetical protein
MDAPGTRLMGAVFVAPELITQLRQKVKVRDKPKTFIPLTTQLSPLNRPFPKML